MNKINLQTFYNHSHFLKDVAEGEMRIDELEKQLTKLPKEESSITVGDLIFSSGKGSVERGLEGKVLDKWYNGKFLSFKIDWDFLSKKKNHCITIERLQDIEEL